jgi:hypothetical protein
MESQAHAKSLQLLLLLNDTGSSMYVAASSQMAAADSAHSMP